MTVFQDLEVHGNATAIRRWLEVMTASAAHGWSRDQQREGDLPGYSCFAREATFDTPPVKLYLIEEPYGLRVTNIVPVGQNLSIQQYNGVVRDFHDSLAQAAAGATGVALRMSPDTYSLAEALPPRVLTYLLRFSGSADDSRKVGSTVDRERWLEFLVAAHEADVQLDERLFARLLAEELGLPDDRATDLASDFRSAMELLRFNDTRREDDLVPAV